MERMVVPVHMRTSLVTQALNVALGSGSLDGLKYLVRLLVGRRRVRASRCARSAHNVSRLRRTSLLNRLKNLPA